MFGLTPFRRGRNDVFDFFNEMEKNFMQSFNNEFFNFKTDIVEKEDKFILEAELPGFNKENIDVKVDDNKLTISAKQDTSTEENKDNYVRKERRYGSFVRSFDVSNVKVDDIKADYKNGILTLELPKKDSGNSNGKKIDIN
ncbi:molecular chaperone [Gottschalkia purinilytica]|uniref:Molecular chaperone n=1 Tax=Gottschalkia purinilytica TaxID=1503 RepID=A0A0L0W843_GOTPU|nr:Hsp20/alpha crystallin family protein [Gottschalkia purinilytica]KNF07714.1 molecular chaperone [Gottschalkia purinilytica]